MPTNERRRMQAEQMIKDNPELVDNEQFQGKLLEMIANSVSSTFFSRGSLIQRWMDPRRDYYKECGYPQTYEVTSEQWQEYYDRHPVAARVVEMMPFECWQLTPDIREDENPDVTTPFEQAFEDLAKDLRGQHSYFRPSEKQAHPIWEACRRVDVASRIGQFGIILLGFDDGLSLNQPVDGWEEPEVGQITWNQEGIELLSPDISKYITVNDRNELVWNAPPEEEEEEEETNGNGKPNGKMKPTEELRRKKKKQSNEKSPQIKREEMTDPQAQSSEAYRTPTPDEGAVQGKSIPDAQAFMNVNPQQGKYRDPMDIHGQDDIQPQGDQQPKLGQLQTEQEEGTSDQDVVEQTAEMDPQQQGRKLLYIRVFPESLVQIIQYEQNMASPRFGQPTMYRVTLNDPTQYYTGAGMPLSTVEVHYSRIIHVNDVGTNFSSSEIFSPPVMRPVLNNLIDLQKIYGSSGEGYWKNAFATLAAETHPQLGGDVTIDTSDMREQMKKWRDSLDRVLAATGITWKTISPQIVDPNSHVSNQLQALCIKLGCPLRVFMGSEQGVLAANEDSRAWYGRVRERRKNYLTPRLIVPLIDRLIQTGVLSVPSEGYSVVWDDEQKLTPQEQAQVAGALTGAMTGYVSGGGDQFMEPVTYLVEVWGWDRDKAQAAIDSTMEHIKKMQEMQAMMPKQMVDPTTGQPLEQDPETGEYIDPNTGEPLQTDEFGKPVMMGPDGQPIPVQSQSPQEGQGPLAPEAAEQSMMEEQDVGGGEGLSTDSNQLGNDPNLAGAEEVAEDGQSVDEETGFPIDPETGLLQDPESGYLIDRKTGDVLDPETKEVLGNLNQLSTQNPEEQEDVSGGEEDEEGPEIPEEGEPVEGEEGDLAGEIREEISSKTGVPEEEVDEESGLPIDPRTGYVVHPSGIMLDRETGNVYDKQGNVVGNINDEEEEGEDEPLS